jgi:hypothetical protein
VAPAVFIAVGHPVASRGRGWRHVTKRVPTPLVTSSCPHARKMLLNGNSAFAVRVDAIHFCQGALAASGACRPCFGGFCLRIQEVT